MNQPVACPNCDGITEVAFRVRDFNRRIPGGLFSYLHCKDCGVYILFEPPSDLGRFYPEAYYTLARSVDELAAWSKSEQYKIDLVRRFRRSGRLIEIGPASGGFLYLAAEAGFDVVAIEMDARACENLSRLLEVEIVNSADEAGALREAPAADVISMWHVIEHVTDPWGFLEVAAQKLQPGGILVIATPNPLAFQFKVLGSHWTHVDAPRHVHLLPPDVIIARGRRLGLTCRLVTTRDVGSIHWNRFGWERTLVNRFHGSVTRAVAAHLGRLLSALAYPIESREGRGAAYTIVLQKPAQ